MTRVLVTGGGGYIGTTLVPYLLGKGYDVTVVDRFFFGRDLLVEHPCLTLIQEDTRRLTPGHFAGVDAVVDLVALSNDPSGEYFQDVTWQINHESRVQTARMAKAAGVGRYVLPSSASIYGFQSPDVVVDESSKTNPLTTYAKANEKAEHGVLPLADENFCVVILRQSTVYGYSPRMRLDLAINGMTFGALTTGKLPLMRDGSQWRPMLHVHDAARAIEFMLAADSKRVNGEIFNVGSDRNVYQLGPLAERIVAALPDKVAIEWYGDPDHRSYRVGFNKIEALGYRAEKVVEDGVAEIIEKVHSGVLTNEDRNYTLRHYQNLERSLDTVKALALHGGMLTIA